MAASVSRNETRIPEKELLPSVVSCWLPWLFVRRGAPAEAGAIKMGGISCADSGCRGRGLLSEGAAKK